MVNAEPNMEAILEKIAKLFALAAKAGTPEEAASAAAKANELMTTYNLSLGEVERTSGVKAGKREKSEVSGGFYQYQRYLYQVVAELNFCHYFCVDEYVRFDVPRMYRGRPTWSRRVSKHKLIGRMANVAATKAMASYLEAAVTRLAKKRLTNSWGAVDHRQLGGNWGISFKTGAVDDLCRRIAARKQINDDKRELEMKKKAAAAGRASSATGLTLVDYAKSEEAANHDFLHGEGTWARMQDHLRKIAEEEAAYEQEMAELAEADPEEFRKREAAARKGRRSSGGHRQRSYQDNTDYGAYRAGREASADISLDLQAEGTKIAGLIGASK